MKISQPYKEIRPFKDPNHPFIIIIIQKQEKTHQDSFEKMPKKDPNVIAVIDR